MVRWEYMTVIAAHDAGEESEWRPVRLDGEELKDWQAGPTLYDFINELGRDGWELVSEWQMDISPDEWEYNWLWADKDFKKMKLESGKTYEGMAGHREYMDTMGSRGWQLVTTTHEVGYSGSSLGWLLLFERRQVPPEWYIRLRFKRPIPDTE